MLRWLVAFVFVSLVLTQGLEACPSLSEAREAYIAKKLNQAIEGLECRLKKNSKDNDSRRLLSDIYWWENKFEESLKHAKEAWAQIEDPKVSSFNSHIYDRIKPYRASFSYDEVLSTNRHSYEMNFAASARYWDKNTVGLEIGRDSRFFDGGPKIADMRYGLSHVWIPIKNFYLLESLSYSHEPDFLPDWVLHVEPHYTWKEFDFGLSGKYRIYETDNVASLRPSVAVAVDDRLLVSLAIDVTLSPEQVASFATAFIIQWNERIESRISFSGGETDEGNGLLDNFYAAGGAISYRIYLPLTLQLQGSIHRGDVREEARVGGRLLAKF